MMHHRTPYTRAPTTVLAEFRPAALLALRALATVLADLRPTALLNESAADRARRFETHRTPCTESADDRARRLMHHRTPCTVCYPVRTSAAHLAVRPILHPVLAWLLRARGLSSASCPSSSPPLPLSVSSTSPYSSWLIHVRSPNRRHPPRAPRSGARHAPATPRQIALVGTPVGKSLVLKTPTRRFHPHQASVRRGARGTRMASARACLEHLTRALAQLGVTTQSTAPPIPLHVGDDSSKDPPFLTAETLRRAKFNHPAACAPLWRALHDLSLVGCAGFPDPDVARRALASAREASARSAMQYAEAQLASGDGATNAGDARSRGRRRGAGGPRRRMCARVARWHLRRQATRTSTSWRRARRAGDSRPPCSRSRGRYALIAKPNRLPNRPASRLPIFPSHLTPNPRLDIDRRRCNATTSSRGRTPTPTPRPSSTRHRAVTHRISTRHCPRSPRIPRAASLHPRWMPRTSRSSSRADETRRSRPSPRRPPPRRRARTSTRAPRR